ncbi:hypothetical protein [Pseudarthrobacter sp. NamE5]|uniref:hypothetical protein n=1 Tax=Pseudarthrobacter sp. NamE5 TaxID=2576839 RepID=UPI00110A2A32|nr:hypothetical protein [Pseudarthrobacter sp. NamE5]TLM86072.1 hypothetical protein FDW84_07340 [Pseudarthrobacter sp. NamE5]
METLKKIVSSQYFPAGAVLTAVVLFWAVGLLGGLSLLNNNQPPLTTLTWMLFVYAAAVLTPLAGAVAAADLVRRWRRTRAEEAVQAMDAGQEEPQPVEEPREVEEETLQAPPAAAAEPEVPAQPTEDVRTGQPAPAPEPSQPKKHPKQAGRKQAA